MHARVKFDDFLCVVSRCAMSGCQAAAGDVTVEPEFAQLTVLRCAITISPVCQLGCGCPAVETPFRRSAPALAARKSNGASEADAWARLVKFIAPIRAGRQPNASAREQFERIRVVGEKRIGLTGNRRRRNETGEA